MQLKPISINLQNYPAPFHSILQGGDLFDSSCSAEAQVIFIDQEEGYFLKSAPAGKLKRESDMMHYFYQKGLSGQVVTYLPGPKKDWMLTVKIPGEDATTEKYLENPKKLCELLAQRLALLHLEDHAHCPVSNHTQQYLDWTQENKNKGMFDPAYLYDQLIPPNAPAVWDYIVANKGALKTDTLLHGDYCLPNVIFDQWQFSGFIDLDRGGVGDRHVDIYWGRWTLDYNLRYILKRNTLAETAVFQQRFIDAYQDVYGKDKVDHDMLRLIGAIETFG